MFSMIENETKRAPVIDFAISQIDRNKTINQCNCIQRENMTSHCFLLEKLLKFRGIKMV